MALSRSSHPNFTLLAARGTCTAQFMAPMVSESTLRVVMFMATEAQIFFPSGVRVTPFFLTDMAPLSWSIVRMVLVLPSPTPTRVASFLRPIGADLLRQYSAFQMW